MEEKVAIVTGGNVGIGKETVKGLLENGYKVVIGCRKVNIAEAMISKLNISNVSVKSLDLTDTDSIKKFVEDFKINNDHLDLLINNSGVMLDEYSLSKEGFEMQFATNHLGHYALTGLLFDHLRKSKESRIVNVSSMAHIRGKTFMKELQAVEGSLSETETLKEKFNKIMKDKFSNFGNYAKSKLANILFTIGLSKKLKDDNIQNVTVYCLHPGLIKTDLFGALKTGYLTVIYKALFKLFAINTKQGAATSLHCALKENASEHNGWYFNKSKPEKNFADIPEYTKAADTLWKLSEVFTNVTF